MADGPSLIHPAHGRAAEGGALLVAEATPLDEVRPLNAGDTATGLAVRKTRGRPFTKGNRAGADRGASLTRVNIDPEAPEDRKRVGRRATSLKNQRASELTIQHGGMPISSAVRVELVAWANATSWSDFFYRAGDAIRGAALAEKASAHQLKAIGICEREAKARESRTDNSKPAPGFVIVEGDPQ